jgi:hypothetical protein
MESNMPVEDKYTAYDPAKTKAQDESRAQDGSVMLVDDKGESLPSFDSRYTQDFEGLLYLGALTKTFSWLGHTFIIRTLTQDEVLTVPILMKPWSGTIGEPKAYATAMASICVVSVDGKELPVPVGGGQGDYAWAYQRFNYAKANWFQYTIDKVYEQYLVLEERAQAVIDAMGKASGSVESKDGSNATSAGPTDEGSSAVSD